MTIEEVQSITLGVATAYVLVLHRRLYRAHVRFQRCADALEVALSGKAQGLEDVPTARAPDG